MITNSLDVAATATAAHAGEAAITVAACASHTGACRRSTASTSRSAAARCSRCSAPTAPARPRSPRSSRATAAPTPATLDVLGFDPARRERAFRERIGIVLQTEGLDPTATVREAVELYGAAYPNPRPWDEVIDLVGLREHADKRAGALSGGQRRRLDLALGICGDPELLFLDEPTTGFDPAARRQSWELIESLSELGKTILLTTHYMDEAQHLADRVVVIAGGRIIAEGTPDSLGRGTAETSFVSFRVPAGLDSDDMPLPDDAEIHHRNGAELQHDDPDERPRAAALVGRRPRRRARGADRQPPEPRGRLPPADPGDRMTRHDLPLAAALDRRPRQVHAAHPARDVLHVRVPADVPGDLQRAQRRRAASAAMGDAGGEVPFAQFYTPSIGIFGLTLACYTSVIFGLATARDIGLLKRDPGHAAADADLPRLVADRRGAHRPRPASS